MGQRGLRVCAQVLAVLRGELFPPYGGGAGGEWARGVEVVEVAGADAVGGVVEGVAAGEDVDAEGGAEEGLVLQVLAHAREVGDDGDGVLVEGGFGADAGDHEELRGLEGAGGEDDFFVGGEGELRAGLVDHDAGGGLVGVEEDALGEGLGEDLDGGLVDGLVEEAGL